MGQFAWKQKNTKMAAIWNKVYDLEKLFAICFTEQCLATLKQSFSLFPARKLLIWAVNSSIAPSHYCISNDVKAKLSKMFDGEMTLFASAFAKPVKIEPNSTN